MEDNLKKILRSISLELRHILEGQYDAHGQWVAGDLERRLNEIGVWRERVPKPLDELPHLSAEDKTARKVVDAYIRLREEAGVPFGEAVAEFVRESAYTWANRLFALRCMEARDIIDEVILQKEAYGGRSLAHNRFTRRNPEASAGEDEGLFTVLFDEFASRSAELTAVFDPHAPATALRPSIAVLKRCIALLSGRESVRGQSPATDEVFKAPDAFGWAYQYWNTEEKSRVFEAVRTKKGTKIEGADIIPATQLYTESYMVKFLVQNSLGALWMGMHPESRLADEWEYYVRDADRAPALRKSVAEITFLDPAVGSGHFLLEAFDMLFAMYEEEGRFNTPEEIAASILNRNLYGIDIDGRATQITLTVLWMRAKERAPNLNIESDEGTLAAFPHHIVATNIRLPRGRDHLAMFLAHHPEDRLLEPALRLVFEGLENAHQLGSLLQLEEPVERELQELKAQQDTRKNELLIAHPALFDKAKQPDLALQSLGDDDWAKWKEDTITRLRRHFDEEAEAADLTSAFFSQIAGKGLEVFDLLSRRYDVVAANPPYLGDKKFGADFKSTLRRLYPTAWKDVLAAFVLRQKQLTCSNGYSAHVTQHALLTLDKFSKLRFALLESTTFEVVALLGARAFVEISGEVVNVTLCSIRNTVPSLHNKIIFIDVSSEIDAGAKRKALINTIQAQIPRNVKSLAQIQLAETPSANFGTYWLPQPMFDSLAKKERTVKDIFFVTKGLKTGQDKRFVRFFWEANNSSRWSNYHKGGGYCRWAGNEMWVVDWSPEVSRVKCKVAETVPPEKFSLLVRDERYYGSTNLVFSAMGGGAFGVRKVRDGVASDAAQGLVPQLDLDAYSILAILNSRPTTAYVRALSGNRLSFDKNYVLPVPLTSVGYDEILSELVKNTCLLKNDLVSKQITNSDYYPPTYFLSFNQNNLTKAINLHQPIILCLEAYIERLIISEALPSKEDERQLLEFVGVPTGWFPLIAGLDALPTVGFQLQDILIELRKMYDKHERRIFQPTELTDLKRRVRAFYEAGTAARHDSSSSESNDTEESDAVDEDGTGPEEEAISSGARLPIPTETLLEELSARLETHPVSIYHLLLEGIEQEGWRCLPEERRFTEDHFTVLVLRLLGHRWPRQIEASEPVPGWTAADGIIPITENGAGQTLLRRLQERIEAELHGVSSKDGDTENKSLRTEGPNFARIEREFADLIGTHLDSWLTSNFFRRHISQFKKRPIAWQIGSQIASKTGGKGRKSSSKSNQGPAFSCLVYYHKLDTGLISNLRKLYVGELLRRYETELRTLEGIANPTSDQSSRKVQLESHIEELNSLDGKLEEVALTGFGPDKLRPKLRQYAVDDAMLSLTFRWLKRLGQTVQDGPLQAWQEAAQDTLLHDDFPLWIHDSVRHLEYTCATVGPKAPDQKTLLTDPTSSDLAPIISARAESMVEGALAIACNNWWRRLDEVVLSPIRQQIKQLEGEVKQIEQELEADEETLSVSRTKEITSLRKQLKTEIADLKKEVRERTARADSVRRKIERWKCKECETWEEWLGAQPLYDELASLDGRRPAPTTVSDFVTQESLYAPDLNDGVRVNIAPLQKAGLLAAEVLASADVDKAIADRAEWRADERRWCREGKLPRPGWWKGEANG